MRCARPRLIGIHSSAGMIRGTRSSGKGRSLRAVLAGQLEGDALLHEDRVAPAPRGGQVRGPHLLEGRDELGRMSGGGAVRAGEDLVEEALAGVVLDRRRGGL